MLQARARWEDVCYAVARCTDTLDTCPTSGMSAMSAVMVEPGLCFIGIKAAFAVHLCGDFLETTPRTNASYQWVPRVCPVSGGSDDDPR